MLLGLAETIAVPPDEGAVQSGQKGTGVRSERGALLAWREKRPDDGRNEVQEEIVMRGQPAVEGALVAPGNVAVRRFAGELGAQLDPCPALLAGMNKIVGERHHDKLRVVAAGAAKTFCSTRAGIEVARRPGQSQGPGGAVAAFPGEPASALRLAERRERLRPCRHHLDAGPSPRRFAVWS